MIKKELFRLVLIAFLLLGPRAAIRAEVIQVTTTRDNVPGSLRAAITWANTHNGNFSIHLEGGTYILNGGPEEDANAGGDLDIDTGGEILIAGIGAEAPIIDGNGQDRVFHILNGKVEIEGVIIQNGRTIPPSEFWTHNRDGGGIYNSATLTLNHCVIRNNRIGTPLKLNTRGHGGGIYNKGVLTISGCTVENNIAGYAWNAVYCLGPGGSGGGIYNGNSLTITDSRICHNEGGDTTSSRDGGMPGDGGGIYNSEEGTASLTDCTISDNFTHDGQGAARGGGNGGFGGGIFSKGTLTLTGCTISGNRTGSGGNGGGDGMGGPGAGGSGAGIYQAGEKNASLTNCTICNNSTGNGGDSEFYYFSGASGGYGGGIFNNSPMTLINCTVSNNSTGAAGADGSDTEEAPPTGGWGGGIYNSGSLDIKNTIVADNQVATKGKGPDCSGSFVSQGYNLVKTYEGFTFSGVLNGNKTGVDPLLAALADNGGPTMTRALKINSPAIDAGSSNGISTDQRGRSRPVDIPGITNVKDGADIGAFELSSLYYISGRITSGSTGVPGVTLSFSNGAGTAVTDSKGNYFHPVDPGWSGTVTPAKEDLAFTPSRRSYLNVSAAATGQDFTAQPYPVSVTITHPEDGSTVAGKVLIEAAVSSQPRGDSIMAVTKAEFYIDGAYQGEDTAMPFQCSWNTGLSGNGSHTIKVKAFNAAGQMGEDEITVTVSNSPRISVNRSQLNFVCLTTGVITFQQDFSIINSGSGILNWTITPDRDWLRCDPLSGTNSALVTVTVYYSSEMEIGTQTGTITITSPEADNSPQTVTVNLTVISGSEGNLPFGSFETPLADSTIKSSVPFTGWALDDVAVKSVKIYREPTPTEGSDPVYIGDALFVEGARPDIPLQYPTYPDNYKAGWGYMMLTNFLPNGGNGYFTFHAVAEDDEGHAVTLGTKTVYCDNQNAVKPFGAIDKPTPGGNAYGIDYNVWGWVLTPLPNYIPSSSSINVYVDGVNLGHPTYNIYRSDIAGLFPGYINSTGAVGYFTLDTTAYANGVHTLSWTAVDSAGNADGIGSRYFNVLNTGVQGASEAKGTGNSQEIQIQNFSNSFEPVQVKKGFNPESEPEILYPDENGRFAIEIKELERLVIYLEDLENENDWGEYKKQTDTHQGFPGKDSGEPRVHPIASNSHLTLNTQHLTLKNTPSPYYYVYLSDGDRLNSLPIGSTLDAERGIFYWQPGPGFTGEYRLVFIEKAANGDVEKKMLKVVIKPKFAVRRSATAAN